ncbi:hypothetical protein ACFE04_020462 [Oxalis oulophora]
MTSINYIIWFSLIFNSETCIIRFHAGPPYQDIAFRIVNKEWDCSHNKGFKSTFERGILHVFWCMSPIIVYNQASNVYHQLAQGQIVSVQQIPLKGIQWRT